MTAPYPTSAGRADLLSDNGGKLADLALAQRFSDKRKCKKDVKSYLNRCIRNGTSDVMRCYNKIIGVIETFYHVRS